MPENFDILLKVGITSVYLDKIHYLSTISQNNLINQRERESKLT